MTIACRPSVGRDGESYSFDLGFGKTEIFLPMGLDRQVTSRPTDLPVGQIELSARQQIVGWLERFAKPIAVVHNMMVSLPLRSARFTLEEHFGR